MTNSTEVSIERKVKRLGILLADLGKLNVIALKFLILQMNTIQHAFEYELLDVDLEDVFLKKLSYEAQVINYAEVRREGDLFLSRFQVFLNKQISRYSISEPLPNYFILVTLAHLSEGFYTEHTRNLAIIALGNWKRSMAPPSIVEFIITLIVAESLASIAPSLKTSTHIGTKGCIFDFTPTLGNARFQVLNGFVCNYCQTVLQSQGFGELVKEFAPILNRQWLGKATDPDTPAGITANLGYHLFFTKGVKATPWENFLITMQQEGVKQLLTLIGSSVGAILIAALLILLGLKR